MKRKQFKKKKSKCKTIVTLDLNNYILGKKEKKKFYLITILSIFLMGMLFYRSIILSLLMLIGLKPIKKLYLKSRVEKEKSQLTKQFKDLLYSLSASFSTGRHMVSALEEAYENLQLIYRNDEPILAEIKEIHYRITDNKENEEMVLMDFAKRSGVEDIQNFMDIYFTCRTTGGDIQKVVNETATVIADKIDMEKEINTITAQKKYEAKVLTVIPIVLIAFLQFTAPEYIDPLYNTIYGRLIMTGSIGMIAASFLWSMKITEIKV